MKKIFTTVAFAICLSASAQTISTIIGNGTAGTGGDNGPASAAQMLRPYTIKKDGSGNTYIIDVQANNIRKVSNAGIITTFAGNGVFGYGGDGGPATAAAFAQPNDIAFDSKGNVFVCDEFNHVIRKIDTAGIISTVAGTYVSGGYGGFGGDGGQAILAQFRYPLSIVFDPMDNLYVSDQMNHRIRMIDTSGVITTIAGTGVNNYSGDGGQATLAEMDRPYALAFDALGNLFFSDYSALVVRKINTSGVVTRVAGNAYNGGYSGEGGLATAATFNAIYNLAIDAGNNIYLSSPNDYRVLKINAAGIISTYVGDGTSGYSGDGGLANAAKLNAPNGICVDAARNLYVCDTYNHVVRKVTPQLGASLDFDGVDDIVNVNQYFGGYDNLGLASFTVEAWINPSDVTGARSIIRKSGDYNLYIDNGILTAEVWPNGTTDQSMITYVGSTTISTTTWTHVAFAYNKNLGTANLYLNGVAEIATSLIGSISNYEPLTIGASTAYGNYFNGKMDEVRLWNVERSACQINAAKNCELSGTQTGLLIYYQFNEGFVGENNSTITSVQDVSVGNNNGSLVNFALAGNTSNWTGSAAVTPGVSCGFVINDLTAYSKTICMGDSVILTASGAINYLWSTSATNDSIVVTPTTFTTYTVTGSDLNGCSITKTVNVTVNNLPVITVNSASTCPGGNVTLIANGAYSYVWSTGDANSSITISPTADSSIIVVGTDFYNCIGSDTAVVTLNIPSLVAYATITASSTNISYGTNVTFTATPVNAGVAPSYQWMKNGVNVGTSSNVYTSNSLLNKDTITCMIYSWDACVVGNSISNKIGITVTSHNSSLAFNGTTNYVNIPLTGGALNNLAATSLSVEAWVNLNNITSNMTILSKSGDYSFYISAGTLGAEVWPNGMGTSVDNVYSGTTSLSANTWTHVAFTWDKLSNTAKFYINGVAQTPALFTNTSAVTEPLWLGKSQLYGDAFKGKMDEVHIWNTARTATQILNDSKCSFVNAQAGLLTSYNFNEGTPGANNATVNTLFNNIGAGYNGTLTSFTLNGTISNWVTDQGATYVYPLAYLTSGTSTICVGQQVSLALSISVTSCTWNGTYIQPTLIAIPSDTTIYTATGSNGTCNYSSSVAIDVNSLPVLAVALSTPTICKGQVEVLTASGADSYLWNTGGEDAVISVSPADTTIYTVTGVNDVTGCQNSIQQQVNVLQPATFSQTIYLCSGENITVGNSLYDASGVYNDTLPAANTCDSIITTNLTVYNPSGSSQTFTVCAGESVSVGSSVYNASGTYTNIFTSYTSCDSTVVTHLTINNAIDVSTTTSLGAISANSNGDAFQWIDCNNGNAIIINENEAQITPLANGNYAVIITVGNCSDTSACVNFLTVGLAKTTSSSIKISPNPNNGNFALQLNATSQVVITNALGQVIVNEMLNAGSQNLNIQDEANGVYFVKVTQNNQQETFKLVKE